MSATKREFMRQEDERCARLGQYHPGDLAEAWVSGYLEALRNANVPEERFAQMLADAMPEDVRRELARKAAHQEAQAYVNAKVASGELVRLPGGLVIEAERYDPQVHGEVTR
jgi:hypothetical protein